MKPIDVYNLAVARRRRYRNLEHIVASEINVAYNYAVRVIRGRFRLAEDLFATDARYSYLYAHNVLMGRFRKGEAVIATSPVNSYGYAYYVLRGPFPLCHNFIKNDPEELWMYWRNILGCAWHDWVHQAMVMHSFNNKGSCEAYFNYVKANGYKSITL